MKHIDNVASFDYWLGRARPGEKVVYYDGFLMMDREKFLKSGGSAEGFPDTIRTGIMAWKAYERGMVMLFQRKRDYFEYEYIAVRV